MTIISFSDVNWLHVVIATLVGMIAGWVWYSPILVGNQWMAAMKITKKDMAGGSSPLPYVKAIAGHFVTATTLAVLIAAFGALSLWEGVQVGLLVGVGLLVATQLIHAGFRGNKVLAWINGGYDLLIVVLMAGILAMWK